MFTRWLIVAGLGRAQLFATDAALFDFVEQRFVADAELFCGTAAVPVDLTQGFFDDGPLCLNRRRFCDVGQSRSDRSHRDRLFRLRLFVVTAVELRFFRLLWPDAGDGSDTRARIRRLRARGPADLRDDELLVLKNHDPPDHVLELPNIS